MGSAADVRIASPGDLSLERELPRNAAVAAQLPRCPELFNLGVREALRSQGIGWLLVAALEDLVRARGHAQIGLGVAFENVRARELYARLGYRESGAPEYVDSWRTVDPSGAEHRLEDCCSFLMKSWARAD